MTTEIIALLSAGIALVAAAGAWGAVFTNRANAKDMIAAQTNIGARTSRATVVSANRQKWIDAIRDDVAAFIAVRSQMVSLAGHQPWGDNGKDAILAESRQLRNEAIMLRARIEMRLNLTEEEHLALLAALDRYDQELSEDANVQLRSAARLIFDIEWKRLKKEASGIEPFVKELDIDRSS